MSVADTIALIADNGDNTAADVRSVFSAVNLRWASWTPVLETTAPADFTGFTVRQAVYCENGFPGAVLIIAHLEITGSATVRGIKGLPTIDTGYQFPSPAGTAQWCLVGQNTHHYSGVGYNMHNLALFSDGTIRFADILSNNALNLTLGADHDLFFWAILPTEAV